MELIQYNGMVVQAFPLHYGRTNKTTGSFTFNDGIGVIRCVADGTFEITWTDDGTATPEEFSATAGQDYVFKGVASLEVTSGTFHLDK